MAERRREGTTLSSSLLHNGVNELLQVGDLSSVRRGDSCRLNEIDVATGQGN
jgi:hypothetical protein